MKMYVKIDLDNNVKWFDANKVYDDMIEVDLTEDEIDIIFMSGFSNYVYSSGKFVFQNNKANEMARQQNLSKFRQFRFHYLEKYDLLRQCALNQDIDPKTNLPYPEITESEKQWRVEVLNFTDKITHETVEADYPELPERLK